MKKILGFLAVLAIALTASVPASADWHGRGGHGWHGGGHSHFFFGFNFPLFYDPYPYYPAYYYAPPPVYYYPPPAYYAPPRVATGPSQCRQFSGNATNDQTGEPFVGTACLWPDGRWHISGGY